MNEHADAMKMVADSSTTSDEPFATELLHPQARVLVVDLGTSYFKLSLFNRRGELELLESVPAPVVASSDGRAEIDVQAFRDCIRDAVQALKRQAGDFEGVKAVSFASQTNTFALFDQTGHPLTPFILWSDGRAADELAAPDRLADHPDFYRTTGVAQLSHLFLPAKLAWLQRNEPAKVDRVARLGLLSDYFTWWLTDRWWTEASVAGLTGLANIHTLEWWPDACSIAKLEVDQLPQIVRAGSSAGAIKPSVAREWGLPDDCQLIVGCLDQFASAIGAGNVSPGSVSETTGTVLATVRCNQEFRPASRAAIFQGPSFRDGLYYQMTFSELSAGILQRYRNLRAPCATFADLDRLAATVSPGAQGLEVHADAFHRPVAEFFTHRTDGHTAAHEVRAILEAVAYELKRQVFILSDGAIPTRVLAGGGAARSSLWLKIKSDVLGCPVVAVDCPETASRGAAWLALSALDCAAIERMANPEHNPTHSLSR